MAGTDTNNATKTNPSDPLLPSVMKAAVATGFGDIDTNVFVRNDWPTPSFPIDTTNIKKDDKKDNDDPLLIIKVLACALAPGDVRVLSGKTDYMQFPPGGLPYVVGSDVCGIVVALSDQAMAENKFQIGDYVINRFDEPKPNGGVAEYRLIKSSLTAKCPSSIDPIVACGLPASAMAAKRIVRSYVQKGSRVLVIGGSGAVGSSVIQYCKMYGASYVVAVSTQSQLCHSLGSDRVIDYRTTNWWEVPEFISQENQLFDVVFDMVNGGRNWEVGGCAGTAIKSSGVYIALISGVRTEIEVHNILDCIKMVVQLVGRMLYSRLNPYVPKWIAPGALKLEDGDLEGLLEDVRSGKLKPLVDPASPFDLNNDVDEVRRAFHLQKSCHAHGKVVIKIM